jgi:hypothetical protein
MMAPYNSTPEEAREELEDVYFSADNNREKPKKTTKARQNTKSKRKVKKTDGEKVKKERLLVPRKQV